MKVFEIFPEIPQLVDPMGRYYRQPHRNEIDFRKGGVAWMKLHTFNLLPEYSSTLPSGVYAGKMWKRHDGVHHLRSKAKPEWLLCWYADIEGTDRCSVEYRPIKLFDALIDQQK